jgi:Sulfotransferase domain
MNWMNFLRGTNSKNELPARPQVRRARLYGVGLGKSGTHSLTGMFSENLRVGHEAEAGELIEKILARHNGLLKEADFHAWLRARDRRLALEVDSSSLNFWLVDFVLREFPEARFVLTIRDCYSWTNSFMNHWLRQSVVDVRWAGLQELRFGSKDGPFAPGEQRLKELGFYPLAAYLKHWTKHNGQVIEKIPPARLLVIRTKELQQRALEIADFAGVPREFVNLDKTHEFSNPAKQDILRQIDQDFLEQQVELQCRPLMAKFFPEIKSLSDVQL